MHKNLTHPKYRPDIDGLRAVAVLAVIGFHAFPKWIHGGFIGVDIFFVISGYLISTIIIGSLENNSFSFLEFYARRINRIFPALLLVLISCLVFGWFTLLPEEYMQLGKHIAGGAGFISNYMFWGESGYFDNSADTKPLLHLWSLGVEEQFYIIWPLLLWLAWKKRFNLLAITLVVATISFGFNIVAIHNGFSSAAFYLPQSRFWELLIGGALAYITLLKERKIQGQDSGINSLLVGLVQRLVVIVSGKRLRNTLSIVGALLIAIGFNYISRAHPFPGWWAILPIVGTAMIIAAGSQAWINQYLLSNRVMVWLGLISYPLYLWHWPLLVIFQKLAVNSPLIMQHPTRLKVTILLFSTLFAYITYKFIENQSPNIKQDKSKSCVFLMLMILTGAGGYFCYKNEGYPIRPWTTLEIINNGDIGYKASHDYMVKNYFPCSPSYIYDSSLFWNKDDVQSRRCFQSQKNGPIDMALIGDSHVEHLFIGLSLELKDKNIVYYAQAGLPYLNSSEFREIFKYVMDDKSIATIIISAYWGLRVIPFDPSIKKNLIQTVDALKGVGKKIYIVDDVPHFQFEPERCKYINSINQTPKCSEPRHLFFNHRDGYINEIREVAKNLHVTILETQDFFCDHQNCRMDLDGNLFYFDNNHLNINGSKFLAHKLLKNYPELSLPPPNIKK